MVGMTENRNKRSNDRCVLFVVFNHNHFKAEFYTGNQTTWLAPWPSSPTPLFNMHQRNHARAFTVILSPTLPVFTSTYDGRSNSD